MQGSLALRIRSTAELFSHLPGDNSDTGVLDGVGLCPGGRKCVGDPLLDPLALPPVEEIKEHVLISLLSLLHCTAEMVINCDSARSLDETYPSAFAGAVDCASPRSVRILAEVLRRRQAALPSSSSCTWIGDFETKF